MKQESTGDLSPCTAAPALSPIEQGKRAELPDDIYLLAATQAERKVSNKDPNSWYMRVTYEITAGKFKGHKHREMYNTGHSDNEIRARAMSDIVKIADAVGFVGQLGGFGPLFGKVFAAEIKQRKEKDKDKDGNEVAVMRARINKVMPAAEGQAKLAASAPQNAEHSQPSPSCTKGFRFVPATEFAGAPAPIEWLVKDWLYSRGLALLSAAPRSFKSFLALDLGFCVATGIEFHGHEVKQGGVFYLCGEGSHGVRRRLAALSQHYNTPLPAGLLASSTGATINTSSGREMITAQMRAAIAGMTEPPRLLIVDTLARALEGDENSQEDAGAFVKAVEQIADEFGICALIVHHTGHGDPSRPRGSTAFPGAVDTDYLMMRTDDCVTVRCRKMKDSDEPEDRFFRFHSVELPPAWGEPGETPTSGVLVPADGPARQTRSTSPKQREAMEAITPVLRSHPEGAPTDAIAAALTSRGLCRDRRRRSELLKHLEEKQYLRRGDGEQSSLWFPGHMTTLADGLGAPS